MVHLVVENPAPVGVVMAATLETTSAWPPAPPTLAALPPVTDPPPAPHPPAPELPALESTPAAPESHRSQKKPLLWWGAAGLILVIVLLTAMTVPVTLTQKDSSSPPEVWNLTRGQTWVEDRNVNDQDDFIYFQVPVEPDDQAITCDVNDPFTLYLRRDAIPDPKSYLYDGTYITDSSQTLYLGQGGTAKVVYLAVPNPQDSFYNLMITCLPSKPLELNVTSPPIPLLSNTYTSYVLDVPVPFTDFMSLVPDRRIRCTTSTSHSSAPIDMYLSWSHPLIFLDYAQYDPNNCGLHFDDANVVCSIANTPSTTVFSYPESSELFVTLASNSTLVEDDVILQCQDLPALQNLAPLFPGMASRPVSLLRGDLVNTTLILDSNSSQGADIRCTTQASNGTAFLFLKFQDYYPDPFLLYWNDCASTKTGTTTQVCVVTPPEFLNNITIPLHLTIRVVEDVVDLTVMCDYVNAPTVIELTSEIASAPVSIDTGIRQVYTLAVDDPGDDIMCIYHGSLDGGELSLHWGVTGSISYFYDCFKMLDVEAASCTVTPPSDARSKPLQVTVSAAEKPLSNVTITCQPVASIPMFDSVPTVPINLGTGDRQSYRFENVTAGYGVTCLATTSNDAIIDLNLHWGGNLTGDDLSVSVECMLQQNVTQQTICRVALSPSVSRLPTLFISSAPADLSASQLQITCTSSPIIKLVDGEKSDQVALAIASFQDYLIAVPDRASLVDCVAEVESGTLVLFLGEGTAPYDLSAFLPCDGTSDSKCSLLSQSKGPVFVTMFANESISSASVTCRTKAPLQISSGTPTYTDSLDSSTPATYLTMYLNGSSDGVRCFTPQANLDFVTFFLRLNDIADEFSYDCVIGWFTSPSCLLRSVNQTDSALYIAAYIAAPLIGVSSNEFIVQCDQFTALELSSGVPSQAFALATGEAQDFVLRVPSGPGEVVCTTSGIMNEKATLYVQLGSPVNMNNGTYQCYRHGSTGSCRVVTSSGETEVFVAVLAHDVVKNVVVKCEATGPTILLAGVPSEAISIVSGSSKLYTLNATASFNASLAHCHLSAESGYADAFFRFGDLPDSMVATYSDVDNASPMSFSDCYTPFGEDSGGECTVPIEKSTTLLYILVRAGDPGIYNLTLSCQEISVVPLVIDVPSNPTFIGTAALPYYWLKVEEDGGYDINCLATGGQNISSRAPASLYLSWGNLPILGKGAESCASGLCFVEYRVGNLYLAAGRPSSNDWVSVNCSRLAPTELALDAPPQVLTSSARGPVQMFLVKVNTSQVEKVTCRTNDPEALTDDIGPFATLSFSWGTAQDLLYDEYSDCTYWPTACTLNTPLPSNPLHAMVDLNVRADWYWNGTGGTLQCVGSRLYAT